MKSLKKNIELMERYIDTVVTASVCIKYDDSVISEEEAYELTREELNTNLELNNGYRIAIEDVCINDIQLI